MSKVSGRAIFPLILAIVLLAGTVLLAARAILQRRTSGSRFRAARTSTRA